MKHIIFVSILLVFVMEGNAVEFSKVSTARLENGLEIVFVENHANPILMSAAIINAGSRFEYDSFSGASHMLEHLLFNGTTHRTQEELYAETDLYGIYNNATTMQDCVMFMMLGPANEAAKILEIQSDMLYHSTLPEEKFEKERGIIIEEMNQNYDRKDYIAELLFRTIAYPHTPYALPVLGTVETIQNMSRQRILKYYKNHYVPGNTTLILMGDFDSEQLLDKVKKSYYGTTPGVASVPHISVELLDITGQNVQYFHTNTELTYFDLALNAPTIIDTNWAAFTVLTEIISKKLNHEFQGMKIGAGYTYNQDFGRLLISGTAKSEDEIKKSIPKIMNVLTDIAETGVTNEDVQGVITSLITDEFFQAERLHHYAMIKASLIATGGWELVQGYSEMLKGVDAGQINAIAQQYVSKPAYIGTVLAAGEADFDQDYLSPTYQLPEKKVDPRIRSEKKIDLTPRPFEVISQSDARKTTTPQRKVVRQTLDNGMVIIIDQNSDSRVFAAHLMAKQRSFHEPEGKAGIADLLHRMFLLGTESKTQEELDAILSNIGTEIRTTDRDFIPFDDYYTTPEFSFIRLNTIDEYYPAALEILADMVIHPRLTEETFQIAKGQLLGILHRKTESVKETARRTFGQELYGDHPLAQSPFGTIETVNAITLEDVKVFHEKYFAANNLVLSIVTNAPATDVMSHITYLFGVISANDNVRESTPPYPLTINDIEVIDDQKSGRAQIYMGALFPIDATDQIALETAGAIFSDRLMFDLREVKGWAYNIGAGISVRDSVGQITIGMGTSTTHVAAALDSIKHHLKTMSESAMITENDVQKAVNWRIRRLAMRQMAREGQAYTYAMYELHDHPLDYYAKYIEKLQTLTPIDVMRAAQLYLNRDHWVTVVVQ